MRKAVLVGLGLLLALPAWGLGLCDYVPPETSLLDIGLSLAYQYLEDPDRPGIEANAGSVSFTYNQIYGAPERGFSLDANGILGLVGFALADALVEGEGAYRHYPDPEAPFFLFGGFEGRWRTSPLYKQPWLQVTLGVGYGRFNDVTPLAKAMLISEDLLRLGAIPAPLSDEALMAVAQEIGRRMEYEKLADLVAAVERIIETDAGVELDAHAVLAIEDRITEAGRERYCGGAIQAGLGYEILDPQMGPRDVVLNASANWAVAPEPRSQLLLRGGISGALPWKDVYRASFVGTYDYELAGGTSFSATYSLEWTKGEGMTAPEDRHAAVFQLGVNIGGWDVALRLTFTKGPGDVAWTQGFSVTAAIDLR